MNRAEFFAALFPDPTAFIQFKVLTIAADGKILPTGDNLYATPDEDVEDFIAQNAERELYFGVASRRDPARIMAEFDAGTRPTTDAREPDCDKLFALYADIDFKNVPRQECERELNEMPVPPDIIVMSGAGYHCYWLLAEPLDVQDAYTVLKRLQSYVKSDDVADAPRILRVPCTMNHKPGRGPVEIVKADMAKRHALSEFDFLPAVADEARPEKRDHVAGDCPGADLVLKAFEERGLLGDELEDGKYSVTCPWIASHDTAGNPTKTVLYVNDEDGPGFNCYSANCAKANGDRRRTIGDVYAEFGLTAAVKVEQIAAKVEREEDLGGERYTDLANAKLLFAEGAGYVRHADEMKDKFYVYNGKVWELRARHALIDVVDRVAQRLFAEAAMLKIEVKVRKDTYNATQQNMTKDAQDVALAEIGRLERQERLRRDGANRLESKDGAYAAVEMVKSLAHVELVELDAHPYALNVQNGVLDLATGMLRAHAPGDLMTKLAGTVYDPEATAPTWQKFLDRVVPDKEVQAFLQRSAGIALCDFIGEHCIWFLYGTGRNGKSTFLHILAHVLGGYAANTKAGTLMVKAHGDDKRNDVAVLRGARLVTATEAEHGQAFAESLVKELSGGDPVTARMLFAEFFTFNPTFKIWLAANYKPTIRGTDEGIWSRIHLVPFTEYIPAEERDRDFWTALEAEAPGVLNWMLQGYRDWRSNGLRSPKAVQAATAAYRAESDVLADFIEDVGLEFGPAYTIRKTELYALYTTWTDSARLKPMSTIEFGKTLSARPDVWQVKGTARGDRAHYWMGVRRAMP